MALRKIYLVNRVCYLPHNIERKLYKAGIATERATEREWYSQLLLKRLNISNKISDLRNMSAKISEKTLYDLADLVIHSSLYGYNYCDNLWLHIWDDHPFACGRYFQYALKEKIIVGENNVFVVYNDSYHLELWQEQLHQDIKDKLGYIYSSDGNIDNNMLNSHIFIVNSETNENFYALVSAIRHLVEE